MTAETPIASARWLTWTVGSTTAGLLLVVGVRLWCLDGLVRRVTIDGPSLAPAFRGQSYLATCGDCAFPFRLDAEHLPTDGRVICPNCGFGENELEAALAMAAERVLIDRWPLWWRAPSRGDVVACAAPDGEWAVKRVAAMPGETLAIQEGDLYDGPTLIRKTPAELRKVRLLVHDNDYQPRKTPALLPRWRGAGLSTGWQADGLGFQITEPVTTPAAYDWLEYEHWPGTGDGQARRIPSPITDNDSFNQGETQRALNTVSDVLVSCRLRASGSGQFALAAVAGQERFEIEVESGRQVILRSSQRTLVTRPLATDFLRTSSQIEFGLCDQQMLFIVDGRQVLCHPYDRPAGRPPDVLHPLAIGARGVGLHVDRLRVWRDVYYLDPDGLSRRWESSSPLADDEFALLGDNQPVSIDSRHWEPAGISRRAMLGVVYEPFWSQCRQSAGLPRSAAAMP